jgi:hypothetical protein
VAHTHDQTLLAKMGFGDPDKKLPLHDAACQYLCEPSTQEGLKRRFTRWLDFKVERARLELPIIKGQGQYMQYVGFVDACLECRYLSEETWPLREHERVVLLNGKNWLVRSAQEWFPEEAVRAEVRYVGPGTQVTSKDWTTLSLMFEVKINPVPLGDVVRQIKLYKAYSEHIQGHTGSQAVWVLLTHYDLDETDVITLRNEGILHMKLGEGFDRFVEARKAARKPSESFVL